MSVRIGDAVFIHGGMPSTVKDRDASSGQLKLESNDKQIKVDTRHGYLNGISAEARVELYKILDDVKASTPDPAARVEQLMAKLNELELDPHNFQLSHYLKAEMAHIMNTYGIKPKEYSFNEVQTR